MRISLIVIILCSYCVFSRPKNAPKNNNFCFNANLPRGIGFLSIKDCKNRSPKIAQYLFKAKNAASNTFPYIVSFQTRGWHFCAGSIIHPRWILTAKHCIPKLSSRKKVSIKPNYNNDARAPGKVYYYQKSFIHPGNNLIDNDIGLLLLEESIPFSYSNKKIHSVKLGTADPPQSTKMTLAGWGQAETGRVSRLRTGNALTKSGGNCQRSLGRNFSPNKMICGGGSQGNICYGDSGGPFVIKGSDTTKDVQYGIASWIRVPCARYSSL